MASLAGEFGPDLSRCTIGPGQNSDYLHGLKRSSFRASFDEAGNIGALIEEAFAVVPKDLLGEVVVVDDASDDGTGGEIKALLGKYARLRHLRHSTRDFLL